MSVTLLEEVGQLALQLTEKIAGLQPAAKAAFTLGDLTLTFGQLKTVLPLFGQIGTDILAAIAEKGINTDDDAIVLEDALGIAAQFWPDAIYPEYAVKFIVLISKHPGTYSGADGNSNAADGSDNAGV